MTAKYRFKAKIWVHNSAGGWHFVHLGIKESEEIKANFGGLSRAWGSIPVTASVGQTSWKTSIFPDKSNGYLLAIKKDVRQKENLKEGDEIDFGVEIDWLF